MNKIVRYTNGNYIVTFDTVTGTKIRQNNLDYFDAEYPESFDCNITTVCDGVCPFCYADCTPSGKHADLFAAKFLDSIHPFTEIAINGNDMTHPQLAAFLTYMKYKGVIVNMTVNQRHFMKELDKIHKWLDMGLIHGLGISLTNPSQEFIAEVKKIPSAVIHMIAGIHTLHDFEMLSYQGLKVLILGYKNVGRGKEYFKDHDNVVDKMLELHDKMGTMIHDHWYEVLSFDNRAIKQLEPEHHMTKEQWTRIFMGDDGIDGEMTSASMYIDLVEGKFARNSCDAERYDLMDDITEMYQFLKKKE